MDGISIALVVKQATLVGTALKPRIRKPPVGQVAQIGRRRIIQADDSMGSNPILTTKKNF